MTGTAWRHAASTAAQGSIPQGVPGFPTMDHRQGLPAAPSSSPRSAAALVEAGFPLAAALVILALLALTASAYLVTEWDGLSRLARLGVFLAGFAVAYGGAWVMLCRAVSLPELGHALVLIGVGLFGPAVLVTVQMFAVVGRLSDVVAVWAGLALLAAVVVPSRPPLWLALLLTLLWSFLETTAFEHPLPIAFLAGWTVCVGVALHRRWVVEVRVAAGVLAVWYGLAGVGLAVNTPWPASAVASLLVLPPAALWGMAAAGEARMLPGARTARHGAFLALLGTLVVLALAPAVGIVPPAGWLLPAVLAALAVVVGLSVQAVVCGPSHDMPLIGAAVILALVRLWLPGLPDLLPHAPPWGAGPPPEWVLPVVVLALFVAFAAWGVRVRRRFVTGAAGTAITVLALGWGLI